MILIILFSFILLSILTDVLIKYVQRKKSGVTIVTQDKTRAFKETSFSVPKGLYFDKTHTWAFMEKNGNVKIGINDFLQHITGPITGIWMKNKGDNIKRGEEALKIIRTGKQLNIYDPISGTIKKQNEELLEDSSMINSSPYNDGWIYIIEPTKWIKETQLMKIAEKASEWLKNEFIRVKDFFAVYSKAEMSEYAHILQDGGALQDGVLADMEPKVWEDFQTKYIDTAK